MCEQEALRLASDRSCGPHNRPKMFAASQRTKVFRADACEVGNFVFGKSLLIGLYGDHFSCRPLRFLQTFRTPENRIQSRSLLFSEQSFCRSLNCSVMARPVVGK
jgi:hypothetical protein